MHLQILSPWHITSCKFFILLFLKGQFQDGNFAERSARDVYWWQSQTITWVLCAPHISTDTDNPDWFELVFRAVKISPLLSCLALAIYFITVGFTGALNCMRVYFSSLRSKRTFSFCRMLANIYERRLASCYISVILQLRANIASATLRDCGTPRITRITFVKLLVPLCSFDLACEVPK